MPNRNVTTYSKLFITILYQTGYAVRSYVVVSSPSVVNQKNHVNFEYSNKSIPIGSDCGCSAPTIEKCLKWYFRRDSCLVTRFNAVTRHGLSFLAA